VAGKPRTAATREKHRLKTRQKKRAAILEVGEAMLAITAGGGADVALAPQRSTADVLAWALRRVDGIMQWAAVQSESVPEAEFWVKYVDAQGNIRVEPNKWFQLERSMRDEAVRLAARMVDLGLAERAVAVEEAKAILVAQAVRTAAEAAGIPPEQIVRLGEELRKGLAAGSVAEPDGVAA
jgi:hypothetical protein